MKGLWIWLSLSPVGVCGPLHRQTRAASRGVTPWGRVVNAGPLCVPVDDLLSWTTMAAPLNPLTSGLMSEIPLSLRPLQG
jgi:hypothetical protein